MKHGSKEIDAFQYFGTIVFVVRVCKTPGQVFDDNLDKFVTRFSQEGQIPVSESVYKASEMRIVRTGLDSDQFLAIEGTYVTR